MGGVVPILEICDRGTDYDGGGRIQEPWWRQTVAWKHLSAALEDISEAARAQHWEYGRHGEVRGGREVAESGAGRGRHWYSGTGTGDVRVGE